MSEHAMNRLGTALTPDATKVMMLGCGELGKEVVIELQRLGVERAARLELAQPLVGEGLGRVGAPLVGVAACARAGGRSARRGRAPRVATGARRERASGRHECYWLIKLPAELGRSHFKFYALSMLFVAGTRGCSGRHRLRVVRPAVRPGLDRDV